MGLGILEKPTWYKEYYKLFNRTTNTECAELNNECVALETKIKKQIKEILEYNKLFIKHCNLDLYSYEFITMNNYNDNEFITNAKKVYLYYSKNNVIKYELIKLFTLAKNLESFNEKHHRLEVLRRCANLKITEYNKLLKLYFNEVQKELILNGNGYMISPVIGTIVISRCKLVNQRNKLDFAATKKNKEKLLAEGKRLYDEAEAEFCAMNGIDYDGVDYRVYLKKEYAYETPLIYPKFKGAYDAEFKTADYRGSSIRGKSNEELINECNRDTNEIIKLPLDMRTKLNMCLECDNILFHKFIRNANQKPIATTKAHR